MPTTDVAPVGATKLDDDHAPAVPLNVEPAPKLIQSLAPIPLVAPIHVPLVSPAIVTVLYSQVFAAEMV